MLQVKIMNTFLQQVDTMESPAYQQLNGELSVKISIKHLKYLFVSFSYCPKTDHWKKVAPMMRYRSAGGVSALRGFVYALGMRDHFNN